MGLFVVYLGLTGRNAYAPEVQQGLYRRLADVFGQMARAGRPVPEWAWLLALGLAGAFLWWWTRRTQTLEE